MPHERNRNVRSVRIIGAGSLMPRDGLWLPLRAALEGEAHAIHRLGAQNEADTACLWHAQCEAC